MAEGWGTRLLLATTAVSIPGLTPQSNETGIGTQCDRAAAGLNSTATYLTWYALNCNPTYTVDSQIWLTMISSAVVGFICLVVFCWGQSFVSVYRGRLLSPHVTLKPPVGNIRNFYSKYLSWLWITMSLSEKELLATAGMDALMFERLIVFGLQFMAPVTVIAMSTLIPIHTASDFLAPASANSQQFAQTNLITLTMGNLPPSAPTLWVHFVLVVLFTCYGMWLLDQHYKSYVLLRQQYLTHGDSVSAWLGRTPRQRPLASHGSMLAGDLHAGEDLSQPIWMFARARVTAERVGSGGHRTAAAAARAGGRVAPHHVTHAAVTAPDDGAAEQRGVALSELTSVHGGDVHEQSPQQPHPLQELQAHALTDLDEHPPQQAPPAAVSPFALQQEEGLLQQNATLQMVQLTDVIFTADSEGSKSDAAQSSMGALPQPAAAAAICTGDDAAASPSEPSSAAGSTLVSRQSSTHALLASKHADSCQTGAPQLQGSPQQGFGFMQPLRSRHTGQRLQPQPSQATSVNGHGEGMDLDSAAGAVPNSTAGKKARRRLSGCGSCPWRRLSPGTSDDDTAGPSVSFAPGVDAPHSPRAAARKAAAAAAAAAAKQLGADVDWWEFKTRDVLLDHHIVQLDVNKDLQGEQSTRPYFWWDLAPSDACSTSGSEGGAASSSSSILPVPGTCLLFDRRSLRTRRPSVRFRNTVHVRSHDGSVVPLHVSNYAVLVTDVPDPGRARRSSSSSCDGDFKAGTMCWQPWENFLGSILQLVEVALEYLMWAWPCLLSREDLLQYAKDWGQASLKSTQSMLIRQPTGDLAQLEAGTLLIDGTQEDQQQQQQPPRSQSQWQRQAVFQSRAFDRPCFDRRRLVELTFRHLFPGDVQAVIPAQEYKALNELLREWNREMQAFIFTAALLKLKHERQQRKQQRELKKASAKAAAEAAAAAGQEQQQQQGAGDSAQQVCIEVTDIQAKVAAQTAMAAAEQGVSSAGSGQLSCGVDGPACAAACGGSSLNSRSITFAAAGTRSDGCQPAAPHPEMVRPASSCSLDDDLSESDDEQGCCSSMARRVCRCRCCFMGAIQDADGRNMLSHQEEPAAGSWCCRMFGARARRPDIGEQISSDALEERREKILKLEEQILEAQKEVRASPDTGNFIVLFKSPRSASLAANSTVYPHEGSVEAFKVQPAPNPEDVLWPSLWASPADRRAVLCKCVFWFAILFAVPTGFFAAAMNGITLSMCSSTQYTRFKWLCDSRFLKFLLTVVVPFILLMVWQNAVIPAQLYRLELRRAVAVSLSQMEHRILLTYCSWELINLFLGGVLSGSLLTQVQKFIEHPETWAQILGGAIPQTSNFFLLYVIQRAFMMNFVRLLMPHGGMWRWLGQMLFTGFTSFRHAATAAYRARIIYPASIRYGREPGLVLLILLIGMAYCVAAPLITIFVLAYMVSAYIVWRYQIIYVSTRAYESGGRMWPSYFLCIIYCLGFFAAFTSSMLIFKKGNLQGMLVLVLLPILYVFNRRCRVRYFAKVDHPPLWLAHTAPRSEIDPLVYTPPCMQPNAQGWFFEAGKPWVRWGVPSYNNPKGPGHDAGGLFC